MGPTSHLLLRPATAAAVAVLATFCSGTIAVAQQFAAYTEEPSASEAVPDQDRPAEAYARQMVPFHTSEAPGTIIVDTAERYLYLVQPNDLAIRYGIGVGRLGFQWSGVERVSRKEEWPDWTPRRKWSDDNPICLGSWPVVQGTLWRAGPLSRSHRVPHSWNERAWDDRARCVVGLHSSR